jgi:fibro-slime domain-containing protein
MSNEVKANSTRTLAMTTTSRFAVALTALALAACGGRQQSQTDTIDAGNVTGTGGSNSSAGTLSTGGAVGYGGASGVGGNSEVGGVVGAGGSIGGTGGVTSDTSATSAAGGTGGSVGSFGNGGVKAPNTSTSFGGTPVRPPSMGGAAPSGGAATTGGSATMGGAATVGGSAAAGGSTVAQVCGNGIVEGTEGCDPAIANNDLGDGCTPTCMIEPTCPPGGGPCSTKCGDGLVFGDEQCDDGNTVSGDGCSATCQVETGFQCAQPPLGSTMVVPMVVRDFDAGGDFEPSASNGLNFANQGLVQSSLDANGLKPVLQSTMGTLSNGYSLLTYTSFIQSTESFAQWYNDEAPAAGNTHHGTLATSLTLYLNDAGTAYVNRWGSKGEQWAKTSSPGDHFCGPVGQEDHDAAGNPIPCTFCPYDADPSTPQCDPAPEQTDCATNPNYLQCVVSGGQYYAIYLLGTYDGTPVWFPADSLTPYSPSSSAQISGYYSGDSSWPDETGKPLHNFSFTTEVRFWFKFDASQTYQLNFLGDDDVWVFINKRLAVDLGGVHTPVGGDLTIAAGTGATSVRVWPAEQNGVGAIANNPTLGLQDGNVYEIAVFQAERTTSGSSYLLSLSGFNTARSVCSHL